MLRPLYKITIQQTKSFVFTDKDGVVKTIPRNRTIELDFVTNYCIESGWETHTNKCTITLPKNIELLDGNSLFKSADTYNVILGGTLNNQNIDGQSITYEPLFMRGDIVTIVDGYRFKNELGVDVKVEKEVFKGYISLIHSEVPIEIECEDNFFLLKHTSFDSQVWGTELVSLCKKVLDLTNKKFHEKDDRYPKLDFFTPDEATANFSLGHLDIGIKTCAEILERLDSQYHLHSTFKGNTLQFGFPIYNENTADSKWFFEFQNNIFDDCDLKYTNKGDIVLSTVVSCKSITKTGRTTKDGKDATKQITTKVLVYWDIVTETFKYVEKKPNEPFPENESGERHECFYSVDLTKPLPTIKELGEYGIKQLNKYYYTGFRGSFETIGYPFIDWNDNVNIIDKVFSDRNGQYKVKKVIREGGDGITQKIFIDFKHQVNINIEETNQILML